MLKDYDSLRMAGKAPEGVHEREEREREFLLESAFASPPSFFARCSISNLASCHMDWVYAWMAAT